MEKFQPLTLSTPSNHLSCGHYTVKVLNLTYISIPIMEPLCKVCNNKGLSFIFLIWCADFPGKWALELRYNSAWCFFRIMAARYMRGETLQNDYWLCFAYTALPVCFVSIRKYLFKVPRTGNPAPYFCHTICGNYMCPDLRHRTLDVSGKVRSCSRGWYGLTAFERP